MAVAPTPHVADCLPIEDEVVRAIGHAGDEWCRQRDDEPQSFHDERKCSAHATHSRWART